MKKKKKITVGTSYEWHEIGTVLPKTGEQKKWYYLGRKDADSCCQGRLDIANNEIKILKDKLSEDPRRSQVQSNALQSLGMACEALSRALLSINRDA